MSLYEIKKLAPWSVVKATGLVSALVVGLNFMISGFFGGTTAMIGLPSTSIPAPAGLYGAIVGLILGIIIGFILVGLTCGILAEFYNLFAKYVGGIKLELAEPKIKTKK